MQSLGEGTLRLDDHTLGELIERDPLLTKVRLKAPKGSTGGGGVLHLSLHYDSSTSKLVSPSMNSSASGAKQSTVGAADAAAAAAAAAAARSAANGVGYGADGAERRSRGYDSAISGVGGGLPPLREVPENDVFRMGEEMYPQKNGSRGVVDLASLSAVRSSLHKVIELSAPA